MPYSNSGMMTDQDTEHWLHLTFATFRYQCFGNPVLGGDVGRCGL